METDAIKECIEVSNAIGPAMKERLNEAKDEIAVLQRECTYRHLAMRYFAQQVDNYSYTGKPNIIGDIIGFWDIARDRASQESGFVVPLGDLFPPSLNTRVEKQ